MFICRPKIKEISLYDIFSSILPFDINNINNKLFSLS